MPSLSCVFSLNSLLELSASSMKTAFFSALDNWASALRVTGACSDLLLGPASSRLSSYFWRSVFSTFGKMSSGWAVVHTRHPFIKAHMTYSGPGLCPAAGAVNTTLLLLHYPASVMWAYLHSHTYWGHLGSARFSFSWWHIYQPGPCWGK